MDSAGGAPYFPPPPEHLGRLPEPLGSQLQQDPPVHAQQKQHPSPADQARAWTEAGPSVSDPYDVQKPSHGTASATYGGWPASLANLDISRFLPPATLPASSVAAPIKENDCHELPGEEADPSGREARGSEQHYSSAQESGPSLSATQLSPGASKGPTLARKREAEPELWKRTQPQMRLHGDPNPVIFECQEERELDYPTVWYRIPEVPDFLICTLCHKMYMDGTELAAGVEAVELPRGRCRFNVPRLTRLLAPGGDLQPIRDFARRRLQVQDCRGTGGAGAEAGVTWFKCDDARLEWFAACEACREDVVLGTRFGPRFAARQEQPADQLWACDVCVPYTRRALLRLSALPPESGGGDDDDDDDRWDAFVEAANRRMRLPRCEGARVEPSAGDQAAARWYRPTAAAPGDRACELALCEACFCDKVALTSLASGFEPVLPPWQQQPQQQHAAANNSTMSCLGPTMPVTAALVSAAAMQDLGVFLAAARAIVASPRCTEAGIGAGQGWWFVLLLPGDNDASPPPAPDFAICAACHAAWIGTWGLSRFFRQATTTTKKTMAAGADPDGSSPRLCSLNPAHPRFGQLLPRLGEAVETGVWERFLAAAETWAGVAPCPRSNMTAGRRWWGHDDCTICEECYLSFCRGSVAGTGAEAAAAPLPLRGSVVAAERMCCMYSPRMRRQWLLCMCDEGGAGLDGLVAFSRQRLAVYAQTVPQIRFLRGMQEIQMTQAMHSGLMSTMYSGMASFREVAGTTDGNLHGSNTLGWYSTEEGATSAAFSQKMSAGLAHSNTPWAQILQLANLWDQWD